MLLQKVFNPILTKPMILGPINGYSLKKGSKQNRKGRYYTLVVLQLQKSKSFETTKYRLKCGISAIIFFR